jgi:uncharacterized protein YprB with RNaseH-like and TPR domain
MGDEIMKKDKTATIRTAREILNSRPVYLDTETTGLGNDAEIVDIAIIDSVGKQFETLAYGLLEEIKRKHNG